MVSAHRQKDLGIVAFQCDSRCKGLPGVLCPTAQRHIHGLKPRLLPVLNLILPASLEPESGVSHSHMHCTLQVP